MNQRRLAIEHIVTLCYKQRSAHDVALPSSMNLSANRML
ncbi:MAG: hypothetical protein KatS3mg038_1004 [Candidatus Kapaibacterium sp.]|nr:MAG: hypothetical protein KatS3mg038_1004 [Candidatus Kapabacteria bacterium]